MTVAGQTMSADRDHELERLAIAKQHVAKAERHIAEQSARIEQMGDDEHALQDAEGLLVPLNALLLDSTTQRVVIAERIEKLDERRL